MRKPGTGIIAIRIFCSLMQFSYLRHFDMSLEEIKEQFENRTVEGTLELYEKTTGQIA